jgi:ribonuclease M5
MLKLSQTIITEGKYDKIKLKSIIDANIITTDGFAIYNDEKKRALIAAIAAKTGIIVLTDSDSAGRRIRNFIKNIAAGAEITNVHIPKVSGKEKRKASPSKENTIGVEGIDKDLLLAAFERFGFGEGAPEQGRKITKADFVADGLSGGQDISKKREWLCYRLDLPYMPSNSLLECLNILAGYEEYKKIVEEFVQLAQK